MRVYASKHKNKNIVKESQSGGMFTAISDYVLDSSGVIYGCVLNEEQRVIHVRAENADLRNQMRGSKYVQSDLGETFLEIKTDLIKDRLVLFSGTPCQVAGLKSFLNREYDNLICIDLVCYGVGSPKIWHDYVKWQESKNRSKISKASFRDKSLYGWNSFVESILFQNNTIKYSGVYRDLFSSNLILRPSCYSCKYKSTDRVGDLTIADCWGIEKVDPDFFDNDGVSLVLVNTNKGEVIFDKIKEAIYYRQIDINDVMQPCLISAFQKPENRETFWRKYRIYPFNLIARQYTELGNQHNGFGKKIKKFAGKVKAMTRSIGKK